jgi:hypothetical protein
MPQRHPQDSFDAVISDIFMRLAASRQARQAEAQPEPRPQTPASPLDAELLAAIAAGDKARFAGALEAGANVNAEGGRPLQVAAENRNFAAMQELMIRGADIQLATASLKAEQKEFESRRNVDREALERILRSPHRGASDPIAALLKQLEASIPPVADPARYKKNASTIALLDEYHAIFLREIAPLENLRLQREILKELRALKEELTGTKLDKPKLKAPSPGANDGL